MQSKLISLACLLYITTVSVQAEELTLTADDGFPLSVEHFSPKQGQERGVLLLHQCNFDQSMYQKIGRQLADNGLHAMSLDFRGFGKSINEQFDVARINSLSEEKQQQALSNLYQHWPSDVRTVLDHLQSHVGEDGAIGVVGASCGGSLALRLSDDFNFLALALFSSAQGDKNIARYEQNLKSVPTYLIAAQEDQMAYSSAERIFAAASNLASKKVIYKGASHGYPLYEQDRGLQHALVEWLTQHL